MFFPIWFPPVVAQVIPDATLSRPSQVNRSGNTQVITEGTIAGQNLFHSFQRFSVRRGESASFRGIAPDTENIITRVTGNSISKINGVIEALQSDGRVSAANFFLLNPNGIIFGEDASLNLGRSFLATTGDRLQFADGTEFRADGASPLITVSTPIGIQFGHDPGAIRNAAIANLVQDDFGRPLQGGLQVQAGETLALVGDRLDIAGGVMIANGGRIELGSVGGNSFVRLRETNPGWILDYGAVRSFQDIKFSGVALLDISDTLELPTGSGSWQLQGRNIVLDENTIFTSQTNGAGNGKDGLIRAEELQLTGRSFISFLTEGTGRSGSLRIGVDRLVMDEGSQIGTLTNGGGEGGRLRLRAAESIDLRGAATTTNTFLFTTIFAQAGTQASPTTRAGDIRITAPNLRLESGAQISTSTFGAAAAGDLTIAANQVDLRGILLQPNGDPLVSADGRLYPTGLFTDTDTNVSGNGGNLLLTTDRLSLREGAFLQTNTEGSGRSGNLTIRARDFVQVTGTTPDGQFPSTLFAASGGVPNVPGFGAVTATGQGGRLDITTRRLQVADGGAIAVTSINPDLSGVGAGNLRVQAEVIELDNGRLLSDSASGNGGNIRLQTRSVLALRNGGQVSATAGVSDRPGNGGNIAIGSGFIIASPLQNNDIIANSFEGRGGNINIDGRGILGLEARQSLPNNQTNDIDASSQLGAPGTIRINAIAINPTQGLVALPANFIDRSQEIAQACRAPAGVDRNRFVTTGRGGLPGNPGEVLRSSTTVLPGWIAFAEENDRAAVVEPSSPIMIEAEGWIRGEDGTVQLVGRSMPLEVIACATE
jgi:filamentous hemagglutinin family protein